MERLTRRFAGNLISINQTKGALFRPLIFIAFIYLKIRITVAAMPLKQCRQNNISKTNRNKYYYKPKEETQYGRF